MTIEIQIHEKEQEKEGIWSRTFDYLEFVLDVVTSEIWPVMMAVLLVAGAIAILAGLLLEAIVVLAVLSGLAAAYYVLSSLF